MLYTCLKHIQNVAQYIKAVNENEHVIVIYGRMDPESITVYRIAQELETEFEYVRFFDMEFGHPELEKHIDLLSYTNEAKVPFVIYYNNGVLIKSICGVQAKAQIKAMLKFQLINLNL